MWGRYLLLVSFAVLLCVKGFSPYDDDTSEGEIQKFVRNNLLEIQLLLDEELGVSDDSAVATPDWEKDPPACHRCVTAVNFVQYFISLKKTTEEIRQIIEEVCLAIKYQPPKVCKELTHSFVPEMVQILKNTTNTPREVCAFVESTQCGNGDVPKHRWSVEMPPTPKPPTKPREAPKPTTPKLKVLHITDTHYDPLYKIGAKDICELKMCCREENGMAMKNESAAGKWGGWKCDIPERTLDNYLEHIKKTHGKFDYIVWTGDLPPHNTWCQTVQDSIFMLNTTVAKVWKAFPNTPIFPALGNHEATPSDQYPSPALGNSEVISWLYETAINNWKPFLPESTFSTIRYGGYYVAPVRPGLKLISLNTNFCYHPNWWLILNSTDPGNMLRWFATELQKAENEKVKVHVIAHIPPGYAGCLKVWSKNFYRIIDRYEATVTAQFYGHTHMDSVEIYYDTETDKRPTGVGYIGPSATTFTYANPSYRVYTVDGDHKESHYFVDNFETWVMNLTEANLHDNPVWYKLFSAKEAYKLKSLLPEEWNNFYERLKTDKSLIETYFKHYWKDSPKRPELNQKYRNNLLCGIRSCVHYGQPKTGDRYIAQPCKMTVIRTKIDRTVISQEKIKTHV